MLPVTGGHHSSPVPEAIHSDVQELKPLTVPLTSNALWSAQACQSGSTPQCQFYLSPF